MGYVGCACDVTVWCACVCVCVCVCMCARARACVRTVCITVTCTSPARAHVCICVHNTLAPQYLRDSNRCSREREGGRKGEGEQDWRDVESIVMWLWLDLAPCGLPAVPVVWPAAVISVWSRFCPSPPLERTKRGCVSTERTRTRSRTAACPP